MSLSQHLATLKAIRTEADRIFEELQALAEADEAASKTLLSRLRKLVTKLDETARRAAADRRRQIIKELGERIRQYDVLLSLDLRSSSRAAIETERATLVAQRGYHRGRIGLDFEGIVSKAEVEKLAALITEVSAAVTAKKKAVAYIDGTIRIAIAATRIIAKIAT